MRNRRLLLGASVLWMVTVSSGQVGEIARQLGLGTKLSDSKISSGLKQALADRRRRSGQAHRSPKWLLR